MFRIFKKITNAISQLCSDIRAIPCIFSWLEF